MAICICKFYAESADASPEMQNWQSLILLDTTTLSWNCESQLAIVNRELWMIKLSWQSWTMFDTTTLTCQLWISFSNYESWMMKLTSSVGNREPCLTQQNSLGCVHCRLQECRRSCRRSFGSQEAHRVAHQSQHKAPDHDGDGNFMMMI